MSRIRDEILTAVKPNFIILHTHGTRLLMKSTVYLETYYYELVHESCYLPRNAGISRLVGYFHFGLDRHISTFCMVNKLCTLCVISSALADI